VEGPVKWEALLLIVSAIVVANAATAWLVYHVCQIVAALERRILRLEFLANEKETRR